jgi:hypothetical protein
MKLKPDEQEQIQAIQRYIKEDRHVDIYHCIQPVKKKVKKWAKRYLTGAVNWYKDDTILNYTVTFYRIPKIREIIVLSGEEPEILDKPGNVLI